MARLFTPSESKYYLMALDAGTGSIRAVIFDLEGNQIAVGQAEWRHLAVPDVPGSMEFDLNKNWQLACECMRQALHNAGIAPEYIAAVSACSMREGIVLYNNEGTPIWACANVDARPALMLTAGRCITGLITASVPITVLLTTMILAV